MSLVSYCNKFIFVHIPKSGGTSISVALKPYANRITKNFMIKETKHHTLSEIREVFGEGINHYYTFAFVRNSWDRVVSLHTYMHTHEGFNESFDEFVEKLATRKDTCRYTTKLQLDYIRDSHRNIDFVGRFENLEEDFAKVTKHLGLDVKPLGKENKTRHSRYRDYYTPKTKDIIYKMFKEDIEHFGYEF